MTLAEFRQYLIDEVEDGNAAWVRARLEEARDRIAAGKGQIAPMTNAAGNGTSFSKTIEFSCVEVAAACRAALKSVDGASGSITVPNFGAGGSISSTWPY